MIKRLLTSFAAVSLLLVSVPASAKTSLIIASNESVALGRSAGLREKGWSPAWIVALSSWYRADLGTTTVSSNLSQWNDQGATANNASQATSTKRPTPSTINGRASWRFTAASSQMMTLASNFTQGAPVTFFAVIKPASLSVTMGIFVSQQLGFYDTAASFNWATYANTFVNSGTTLSTGTAYAIACNIQAANKIDFWTNGILNAAVATGTGFPSRTGSAIGADPSGSQFIDADVGEIILVSRSLDVGEISRWRAYEAAFWGIGY